MIQSSLGRKSYNSRDVFILPEQKSTVLSYLESVKESIFKQLFIRENKILKYLLLMQRLMISGMFQKLMILFLF